MAGFQKLDKKQLPQVIGLGVASCGLFGYFAVKMIAPTASAAPPPKSAASATAGTTASGSAATSASSGASSAPDANNAPVPDAPPPTLAMRDPFVPQENPEQDPATPITQAAPVVANVPPQPSTAPTDSATSSLPSVPPANLGPVPGGLTAPNSPGTLPSQPAPIAALPPAAPAWTLTGVLESGSSEVAILRNGDARAYVQPGEMVDANFRVVDVTRSFVELRHGSQTFTLTLGGPKLPPAKPGTAPTAVPVPIPVSGSPLPQSSSPAGTAIAPIIPASAEKQITPSD